MFKIGGKIEHNRVDGNLRLLKEDLDFFTKIGLDAVEIPPHGLDVIINGKINKRQLSEVKKILLDYDFFYSVHSPDPTNLMDIDNYELHVSVLRSSLEFALDIGANVVVYHAGRFIPEEKFFLNIPFYLSEIERNKLMEIEALSIALLSEEYPEINICIENARPYLFNPSYTYAEKLELLKQQILRIGKNNVKITLDLGHLYLSSRFYNFSAIKSVLEIKELINHVHIHDNCGRIESYFEKQQTKLLPFGKGDSHMPIGWGEIPIKEILSTFINSFNGILIMEIKSRYNKYIEESKKNLEKILSEIFVKDNSLLQFCHSNIGEICVSPLKGEIHTNSVF